MIPSRFARTLAALSFAMLPLLPATPAHAQRRAKKVASCCTPAARTTSSSKEKSPAGAIDIPDVTLIDQEGRQVRLRELIEGKVVAMNFIFTTCGTICPPMGANFSRLQGLLGDKAEGHAMLISVSIDPATDTPARLKAWKEKFNGSGGAEWRLLTGTRRDVEKLLKALKVFTPVREEHTPVVLIGEGGGREWIRANGLVNAGKLAEIIEGRLAAKPHAEAHDASHPAHAPASTKEAVAEGASMKSAVATNDDPELKYFTDVTLRNQFGEDMRLYSDLLRGKVVVINPFFAECAGSCPMMNAKMEQLQSHLGDRIGREVHLITITVDPVNDTAGMLADYAARFHAKRGWYFLSGKRENVELALRKLGQYVEARENHSTIILVGNVGTRLWKKVNGLAPASDIIDIVDGVISDNGGER